MNITATNMHFSKLNELIRNSSDKNITIDSCIGQRYIASGLSDKNITINGIPGNALGSYLDGAKITVSENAQDALGDTMNDGEIIVHGNSGDATGYAMRGGKIFVRGNTGYRTGIHMKAYKDKKPVIIVGETTGNFLGEYLAGGIIIVLGLSCESGVPVGSFCATGMHGGKIFIRGKAPSDLTRQIIAADATESDMEEIKDYITEFCSIYNISEDEVFRIPFTVLTPDSKNPYKQLYTYN